MVKGTKKANAKTKVKSLPARSLTSKQAKKVKGGTTMAIPAVQRTGQISMADGSVRPINNINFQKV
jgi:hypothetical protein